MKKLVIILICIILIGGLVFLFRDQITSIFFRTDEVMTVVEDPHARLSINNEAYRQADSLRAAGGNPQRVVELYQQALMLATDPAERGQIQFKIASAGARVYTDVSIAQLKQLVADEAQSDLQRAYAAQELGQIYYKNTNKNVTDSLFAGDPYSTFYTEGDPKLALRRLFEYASSFYPLALAELRAARWYADEVYKLKQKEILTGDEQIRIDSYVSRIRQKLTLADIDIERTKEAPNAQLLIPEALARKAEILGRMSLAEIEAFADPDQAFQEAINAGVVIKDDGPPRIGYATYLARKYEKSRREDIITVLAPLTSNIDTYPQGTKIYLGAERNNVLGLKETFIYIASLAPDFKKMLLSLGWNETDFSL